MQRYIHMTSGYQALGMILLGVVIAIMMLVVFACLIIAIKQSKQERDAGEDKDSKQWWEDDTPDLMP